MGDLRYPIGKFEHEGPISGDLIAAWIDRIERLPRELREVVGGLSAGQLDTPYRPEGWTIRQVVHHIPDSHLNSYVRFKWTLTEDAPRIKAYDEVEWAKLADYRLTPVEMSIDFLELLHAKWVILLRSLSEEQLERKFIHPVSGPTTLARALGSYAWHGQHHLAHITTTIEREQWHRPTTTE